MPRGRKAGVQSIDEQIAAIDAEIENCKQKIVKARQKRKALVTRRDSEEMDALYQAVKNSGKTARDFLEALKKQAQ